MRAAKNDEGIGVVDTTSPHPFHACVPFLRREVSPDLGTATQEPCGTLTRPAVRLGAQAHRPCGAAADAIRMRGPRPVFVAPRGCFLALRVGGGRADPTRGAGASARRGNAGHCARRGAGNARRGREAAGGRKVCERGRAMRGGPRRGPRRD